MSSIAREIKANAQFKGLDPSEIRNALDDLLYNFESGGTFATAGTYPEAPLPGLSLRGFGPIPLPLTERDAYAIIKQRLEPGKG